MLSLPDNTKRILLELARREVRLAARGENASGFVHGDPVRIDSAGAFVTLRRGGRLRGCIGQISTIDPLTAIVAHCARAAALDDPRFQPLRAEELPEIEIELSILSPAEDTTLQDIETGKHGVIVSKGSKRGLLLPQVAPQFHLSAERFLEEACCKAGLDREAWREPDTRIQTFTADVFSGAANMDAQVAGISSFRKN